MTIKVDLPTAAVVYAGREYTLTYTPDFEWGCWRWEIEDHDCEELSDLVNCLDRDEDDFPTKLQALIDE